MSDTAVSKPGPLCKAYLNTGSFGTPVWVEVKCLDSFKLNFQWDKGEIKSRASRVKRSAKSLVGINWDGSLVSGVDADNLATLLAATLDDTVLDMMILDGDKSADGVRGFRGDMILTQANEDQGTGVANVTPEVVVEPALTDNPFQSVLVTTGAPAFTTM
jgi:hypothetical protein